MNKLSSIMSIPTPPHRRSLRPLAVPVLLLAGLGCESYKPPDGLPTTTMTIGTRKYTLEIARNDAHRQKGLMERDSIPADWGMIFVFPTEDQLGFWMKNTRIPLDILYVSGTGRVVSIHTMKPYDLTSVPSKGPARYAIELNAGQAALTGVKEGDVLVIPPEAAATSE
jgi:uncharacterized protein